MKFRSSEWFGLEDRDGFVHRSWMKNQGLPQHLFDGRPVIGICNTWSELTPCNAHFREIAEHVKRGVYEAGGFPLEFPVMSLGETLIRPTTMLFRNLVSMDVEESIRANPMDGVVLLAGCDKTTPSLLMGAASTMACVVEALGMGLPSNAAIPAVDSRRYVLAHMAGQRIVAMVKEDLKMSKILTRAAFENAIRVVGAIGGSTNAVLHLLAIAGRMGVNLTLADWDQLGRNVPCLVNLMPSGKFLMEDFYYAGGLPAVIRELGGLIHKDALTVNGKTMGENVADAPCYNREVVRPLNEPLKANSGIAVLRGNLCPDGAVLKPSAATRELMKHRGRAVVFENIEEFHTRVDDPALEIDPTCVMVLKNCGPRGYPGMPEVGNMPLPPKILKMGVTDMVRISDARMSGTAFGTVALHLSPEAAAGGVLALVQNGDAIELDVEARRLHLDVSEAEISRRRAAWRAP